VDLKFKLLAIKVQGMFGSHHSMCVSISTEYQVFKDTFHFQM